MLKNLACCITKTGVFFMFTIKPSACTSTTVSTLGKANELLKPRQDYTRLASLLNVACVIYRLFLEMHVFFTNAHILHFRRCFSSYNNVLYVR